MRNMKNSYSLKLPADVAEFIETQYLVLRRRFPQAKFTRQMLIELYFKSGVISMTGVVGRLDSFAAAFGGWNEAKMLRSFEKTFFTKGMKGLVQDAKSAFEGVSLQFNGTPIVPNKPVRAVPNGKPCPSCRPVSAGSKPKPAKLRLVKK